MAVEARPNQATFSSVSWRIVARGGIVLMISSISTRSCSLLNKAFFPFPHGHMIAPGSM
jgi:hypothetical protein